MEREGYGEAAERIHELFLAGRRDEAIAAVPDEYIDEGGALRHRVERIRERWRKHWEDCRRHRAHRPHAAGRGATS